MQDIKSLVENYERIERKHNIGRTGFDNSNKNAKYGEIDFFERNLKFKLSTN